MSSEIIQNEASLILIATASILMDRILRHDLVSERLQCQVWSWLTLALSIRSSSSVEEQNNGGVDEFRLFENWLHAVVFANIAAIFAHSTLQRSTIHPGSGGRGIIFSSSQSTQQYQIIVDLLPFSAWLAMLSSSIPILLVQDPSSVWHFNSRDAILWTCQVFVVSLAILWALQWHFHRKARIAHEVQAIPSTNYSADHLGTSAAARMDESQWYTWNVAQTWHWMSTQVFARLEDNNNNSSSNDDDDSQFVLRLLAPQRIRGTILDTLTIHRLVETLHIPYGAAAQLSQAIERLTLRHPRPRGGIHNHNHNHIHNHNNDLQSAMDKSPPNSSSFMESPTDWLTLHDREYNNPSAHRQPTNSRYRNTDSTSGERFANDPSASGQNLHSSFSQQQLSIPTLGPDQEEKLASIMKERFGLELPSMKTPSDASSTYDQDWSASATPQETPTLSRSSLDRTGEHYFRPPPVHVPVPHPLQSTTGTIPREDDQATNNRSRNHHQPDDDSLSSHTSVPPSLLATMPPNIREIVQRRPDLVQQLLAEKQQQQQQQQQLLGSSSPLRNSRRGVDGVIYENEEEEFQDEYGHDSTSQQDDETTSLIQRRLRPKYKSTEGNNTT